MDYNQGYGFEIKIDKIKTKKFGFELKTKFFKKFKSKLKKIRIVNSLINMQTMSIFNKNYRTNASIE